MKDYSEIGEIQVLDSASDVNHLLKTYWVLLDIFHDDGRCFFVLGKPYAHSFECELPDYEDEAG